MPIKFRIRTVSHYPKQGVMFRDITNLLKNTVGLRTTVDELARRYGNMRIDRVVGMIIVVVTNQAGIGRPPLAQNCHHLFPTYIKYF